MQTVACEINRIKRERELRYLLRLEIQLVRGPSLRDRLAAGGYETDSQLLGQLANEGGGFKLTIGGIQKILQVSFFVCPEESGRELLY